MSLEKSDLILRLKLYKAEEPMQQYLIEALAAVLAGSGFIEETTLDIMYYDSHTYTFKVSITNTL
jgi:hypothetical protein